MTKNLTAALAVAAILGLATGAGAGYYTTSRAAATPTAVVVAAASGPGAGTPGAGQAGQFAAKPGAGQGGPGGGNNATIEKVDGTTATVKTGNGNSVDVPLASATLQKQEKIASTDLKVGDNVVGRGDGGEGSITIRNLQVTANAPRGQLGQGGGNQPRGFVVGSIAKIDGKVLTITPPSGSAVSATLADDAQIERVAPAQPTDLKAGQTVALQRPQGGNGATVLTIVSS